MLLYYLLIISLLYYSTNSNYLQCHITRKKITNRIPLFLGVLLPNEYKKSLEYSMNIALNHIHNQSCILNDYYLHLLFKDTEVWQMY